jgi:predicted CoA-binding protein
MLIDWPDADVPASLARAGYEVIAQEGPTLYAVYEARGDDVARRERDEPRNVESVYAYRPLDELTDVAETAARLGAREVWWETGPDPATPDENERAQAIIEAAGLRFHTGRPKGAGS